MNYIYDVAKFVETLPGQDIHDKSSKPRCSNSEAHGQKIDSTEHQLEYRWTCMIVSTKSDDPFQRNRHTPIT